MSAAAKSAVNLSQKILISQLEGFKPYEGTQPDWSSL
jgi:hypothetical protein